VEVIPIKRNYSCADIDAHPFSLPKVEECDIPDQGRDVRIAFEIIT
jgi:hypothetical protein